jgi:hypothetical protein
MSIKYDYKVVSARPNQMFLQIMYSKDGSPDIFKSFSGITDFSELKILSIIKDNAEFAISEWDKLSTVTTSDEDFENINISGTETYKNNIGNAIPVYDDLNFKVVETMTETDDEIIQDYEIVELTLDEKAVNADYWRGKTEVSMRQAKLALRETNLLTAIQDALLLLPEPLKTDAQIEWDNSATVHRTHGLVDDILKSLGKTDDDIDQLFQLAMNK